MALRWRGCAAWDEAVQYFTNAGNTNIRLRAEADIEANNYFEPKEIVHTISNHMLAQINMPSVQVTTRRDVEMHMKIRNNGFDPRLQKAEPLDDLENCLGPK